MGKEVGWAGEEAKRPLRRLLTLAVRGAVKVSGLGWRRGRQCLSSPFGGQEPQNAGRGSSVPWLPICRVLQRPLVSLPVER